MTTEKTRPIKLYELEFEYFNPEKVILTIPEHSEEEAINLALTAFQGAKNITLKSVKEIGAVILNPAEAADGAEEPELLTITDFAEPAAAPAVQKAGSPTTTKKVRDSDPAFANTTVEVERGVETIKVNVGEENYGK